MPTANFVTRPARNNEGRAIQLLSCAAFQVPHEICNNPQLMYLQPDKVAGLVASFPQGQFVLLDGDQIIGFALTIRTNRSPEVSFNTWAEAMGGPGPGNIHDPEGQWLYGLEFAIRADYRGRGAGSQLYAARFQLVQDLGLHGFHATGILMGYHAHANHLSPAEYGQAVIEGRLHDPTVTMQMHRGFQALRVVENYLEEFPQSGNAGVVIVWYNREKRNQQIS